MNYNSLRKAGRGKLITIEQGYITQQALLLSLIQEFEQYEPTRIHGRIDAHFVERQGGTSQG